VVLEKITEILQGNYEKMNFNIFLCRIDFVCIVIKLYFAKIK
jgi:hypothetical protein